MECWVTATHIQDSKSSFFPITPLFQDQATVVCIVPVDVLIGEMSTRRGFSYLPGPLANSICRCVDKCSAKTASYSRFCVFMTTIIVSIVK
jgi:hypothetical protein